jgi:ubiquitin-protein ligase
MRKKVQEERERAKRMAGKRLMKDMKSLNDSITPLVGITAQPLENSIFTWHGNF